MRSASAAIAASVALLTGCAGFGGDEPAAINEGELASLVLQPRDLEGDWLQFDEGPQAPADGVAGPRADPRRFGRVEGWKARYRRPGSPATRGPLVVESRVDLFDGEKGAREELEAFGEDIDGGRILRGADRIDPPALGDESVAGVLQEGPDATALRYYVFAWREGAVTASVLVNGFARGLTSAQALELARKQQRRIAAAGDG